MVVNSEITILKLEIKGVHSVGSIKIESNYSKSNEPNYHFTFSIIEPNYPKTELTEPNLFRLTRSVNQINRNFQNLIFLYIKMIKR